MDKVFIVLQESNVDGEILINATPCESFDVAKSVMNDEIDTLLTEEQSKYYGLDLDKAEERTNDEDDLENEFNVERTEYHTYITCNVDDYHEYIEIVEKEIVKK